MQLFDAVWKRLREEGNMKTTTDTEYCLTLVIHPENTDTDHPFSVMLTRLDSWDHGATSQLSLLTTDGWKLIEDQGNGEVAYGDGDLPHVRPPMLYNSTPLSVEMPPPSSPFQADHTVLTPDRSPSGLIIPGRG